ncbi:MAG: ABC transporter substrate-binding protein [Anaerolineaceae bacterium]|nr:ABC transporter substrate-binding protein [Anaerolineaceae bacterium]
MKRLIRNLALLLICIALFLASCASQPEEKSTSFTITDALGREVAFEQEPERISIAGSGTLMLADAFFAFPEAADRVVTVAKTDQGFGSFTEVIDPKLTPEMVIDTKASVEEIAAFQPDLVVLKGYMAERLGNPLEKIGIKVVYMNLETVEQYQQDLTNIGILLGNPSRAEQLIQYYQDVVIKVTSAFTDDQIHKPTTLFLYYSVKDGNISFNVPPIDWAQTKMIERAGGDPVWHDIEFGDGWTQINFEQIAVWNPDKIFLTAYFTDVEAVADQLRSDPQWQNLKAIQNNELYAFPIAYYSWDQPHTRWGVAQFWLAQKIHPELFADFNFDRESRYLYQLFYDMDDEAYDQLILPKLKGDIQ